jgi:Uma2 family endonuclease
LSLVTKPEVEMSTAQILELVSVEDYLGGEMDSTVRHEFVAGHVYPRVDTTNAHNVIAGNTLGILGMQLRRKPCRPFNSDTKIRIQSAGDTRFYYPDVSVVCESNPLDEVYQDQPVVIVEVLSESTRRVDDGEKREAYLTIPSLQQYILLEQETAAAVVYQRGDDSFTRRGYAKLDDVIELPSIGASLALHEVYEGALVDSSE